tara:strand:- start:304 stop:522 length:219 start_codon:yes stop_codon:yes gene_type:complete
MSDWLSSGIRTMASSVGKVPINIDKLNGINWTDQIKIDINAYSSYKNQYIKRSESDNNYLWQTVALKIKDLH